MWWHRQAAPEVEAALRQVPIFSGLKRRELKGLAAAFLLRHYGPGESILEEGDTGLGMFVITAGQVEVFKIHDGRKVPLAVLGAGVPLGEMALFDNQPRSASATALEPTDCLLLSRDQFRTLKNRQPRVAWLIVPFLAGRVRDLQEKWLKGPDGGSATAREEARADEAGADDAHTDAPASKPEAPRSAPEPADDSDDSGTDVLRAPYALMMTGAVGFGESVRLAEVFFRRLDETSGLAAGRPMGDVLRALPASAAAAGVSSWEEGRRLPLKLLGTFRDHLRSDWRDGDC